MGFQIIPQWTTRYNCLDINVGFPLHLWRHRPAAVPPNQAIVDSVLAATYPTPPINIKIMGIFPILY